MNAGNKYEGLSNEELRAKLLTMEQEAAKGKANGSKISWKISEKGGVSVYGLGRFPVTLYFSQWDALLTNAADLRVWLDQQKAQGLLAEKATKA